MPRTPSFSITLDVTGRKPFVAYTGTSYRNRGDFALRIAQAHGRERFDTCHITGLADAEGRLTLIIGAAAAARSAPADLHRHPLLVTDLIRGDFGEEPERLDVERHAGSSLLVVRSHR